MKKGEDGRENGRRGREGRRGGKEGKKSHGGSTWEVIPEADNKEQDCYLVSFVRLKL